MASLGLRPPVGDRKRVLDRFYRALQLSVSVPPSMLARTSLLSSAVSASGASVSFPYLVVFVRLTPCIALAQVCRSFVLFKLHITGLPTPFAEDKT